MKKVVKIIGRIGLGLIILLILGISVLAIKNKCALAKESYLLKTGYGQMVEVDGKNICVSVEGTGEEVIVISPGFGAVSPVLEMKGLRENLKKQYTVVTMEPLGYGLSDEVRTIRTTENITEEMHQVLSKLGYKKYILMGHSISGLYGLYYANKYPDEVTAYVGIDSSVPGQADEEDSLTSCRILSWMNKLGIYRFLAAYDEEGIVPQIKGHTYTETEQQLYEALFYKNFLNDTMLNEFKCSADNLNKTVNLKFPNQIPVLYMLSSQNCESDPNWQKLHEAVITKQTKNQIQVLDGTHYLHYQYADEMAQIIERWRKENRLS